MQALITKIHQFFINKLIFAIISKHTAQFFTTNILLKLFSIATSFLLFYYFEARNITEKIITVPLNIKTPNNLTIGNQTPANVNMYVSGYKIDIASLDVNDIIAEINVKAKKEGTYTFKPIPKGNIPPNIDIFRISPENINISLEKASAKYVTVEPNFYGTIASNYSKNYQITPKKIRIEGPIQILDSIFVLKTEPISIANLDTDKVVQVLISKSTTPLIRYNHSTKFTINIKVENHVSILSYNESVPIQPQNLKNYLVIKNKKDLFATNITYKVTTNTNTNSTNDKGIASSTKGNVHMYIDLKDIEKAGSYEKIVHSEIDDKWQIIDFTPKSIVVVIENNPELTLE